MAPLSPSRGRTARVRPAYRERMRVPVRWWIQWGLMVATFWLAMTAAIPGPLPWYITGALVVLLIWLLLLLTCWCCCSHRCYLQSTTTTTTTTSGSCSSWL